MPYIIGTNLPERLKAQALNAYGYRWTVENRERALKWYHGREPHYAPLTDTEWLSQYAFAVTRAGELDQRNRRARSLAEVETYTSE